MGSKPRQGRGWDVQGPGSVFAVNQLDVGPSQLPEIGFPCEEGFAPPPPPQLPGTGCELTSFCGTLAVSVHFLPTS